MAGWPLDLAAARLLLTNDDGIHAPGLAALARIAARLCEDIWIVAPETDHTGAGHSLTLRRPLRIARHDGDGRRFAIDGTPTDCVLLAVNEIMRDRRPDLVLSGVNRGGNLGEDVTYSGTVAAAMEATILGIPAIALSQHCDFAAGAAVHWDTAERHGPELVRRLVAAGWPANTLINVNFPPVPAGRVRGLRPTRLGRLKIGDTILRAADPRGQPCYWIGGKQEGEPPGEGTDLAAIAAGAVSVTPIALDLTDREALSRLERLFA